MSTIVYPPNKFKEDWEKKPNKEVKFSVLLGGKLADWTRIAESVSEQEMIELTENIDECPEDFEGPCYCKYCQTC